MKYKMNEVLVYQPYRKSQTTVKRHYLKWREQQKPPIPMRCDIEGCYFHINPLIWNSKRLKLILDHKNGVSGDNRPKNLRLLCPNCNSQLSTHGGGNKGKAEQGDGGFSIKRMDGKKDYTLVAKSAKFKSNYGKESI